MADTLFALWMTFASALVLLFFYAAWLNVRSRHARSVKLGELIPSFLRVDIESFSQLVLSHAFCGDGAGEHRREQVRLTMDCLRRMSHNAALLQQLGYSQISSGNQLISELAQQMIDAGVYVRLYSFIGLAVLRFRSILGLRPVPGFVAARIMVTQQMMRENLVPAYQLLKDKAGNLTFLKYSAYYDALVENL